MGTVASVLMSETFAPEDRAFYQGLTFTVFGAGIGLGGPIGGFLTQYFGWRAAFYGKPYHIWRALITSSGPHRRDRYLPHPFHHSAGKRRNIRPTIKGHFEADRLWRIVHPFSFSECRSTTEPI
jgi:hypothetical protein